MAMELSTPPVPADWARHTPTSAPGAHGALLEDVPPSAERIGPVVRNLLAHYLGRAEQLPASSREDIDLRWIEAMLSVDQRRHPGQPLAVGRSLVSRL